MHASTNPLEVGTAWLRLRPEHGKGESADRPAEPHSRRLFPVLGMYFDFCIRNTMSLRNVTLKGLAGISLYTYAHQADALVIIAPDSEHQESW